ncbi:von Ebner gland protein 2-like [Ctenodactylus gundi]
MGTVSPLLLAMVLSLLSVLQAESLPLTPASSNKLLGSWYILRWAGDMPVPEKKKTHPLPAFRFIKNNINKLEFRMNIKKSAGCFLYKLPLDEFEAVGIFHVWNGHFIVMQFLPGRDHAIAYYQGKMDNTVYKMTMLMGRSRDENSDTVRLFEIFVEQMGLENTSIINPPLADNCELTRNP